MGKDNGGGDRGRKAPKSGWIGGPVAELRADLRGALDDVRSAVRDVREASTGLGSLLGDVVRQVTDVDTIKALADPTRLAILRALMDDGGRGPRVMSAKELAEELGEPQTKLYRHLKVLADAHLIEVAETRLVSGIVETRYRAAQTELSMDTENLDLHEVGDDTLALVRTAMDEYRDRFLAAAVQRYELAEARRTDPKEAFRGTGSIQTTGCRVAPEKAAEFRRRIDDLIRDIDAAGQEPDGVALEFMLSWYARLGSGPERRSAPGSRG